jgi:hypothetical protein|tara:strand:- start:510 stop:1763 length:1254 start_codon:yes stop_codon:yes gene_type:complete
MLSQLKKNSIFKHPIFILIILSLKLHSQDINNQYNLQLTPDLSNQWWSKYNNYGQEPSETYFHYNTSYKYKNVNFNVNIFASKDKIYIGESFVQSKLFNNTYIKAGKYYKDFSSYLNESLSSGSLLVSNNAEPMTKIGLISSYKFKKTTNFDFDFGISHGLFDKSKNYSKAPFLHEKFIYLNYSKNQNDFGIGLVHEAIWAGSTTYNGDYESSFKDFLKVFISADGPLLDGEPHANALGNHLGIWDFYYKKTMSDNEIKLYYQHFFEDTSGLRFANKSDGLWGIELSNFAQNTNILFEYLNTKNQDTNPPYVDENYYNHGKYREGWSYKGYIVGNPFINAGNYEDVNPSKVFHLGVKNNKLNKFSYKLLLSRKIDISDTMKYYISFGRVVNQYLIGIIVAGEESKGNNMSIKLSYNL